MYKVHVGAIDPYTAQAQQSFAPISRYHITYARRRTFPTGNIWYYTIHYAYIRICARINAGIHVRTYGNHNYPRLG